MKIISPGGEQAEMYRNRKGFFSYNVQAICDARLKIRDVVARWPGSVHDATIFSQSAIKNRLQNNPGALADSVLVADTENLFNESLIRTRNAVERCYGVWKRRFPILALGIRLNLVKVQYVIVATAVLHNMAVDENLLEPSLLNEEENQAIVAVNDIPVQQHPGNRNMQNNITRLNIINSHFAHMQ
ncbi:hypothetical protein PPYR_01861 [Photinus pyralis]|uniref:DDE Tnp4 domain-containing protein n=1 Tax=Photinus pyralis TaxID=7054 RepID=A0A5N4B5K4_PHOPY|nr:hypothetical protein PPYR_01861 [Photinus pyralis]